MNRNVKCDFNNIDLNSDKSVQYKQIRKSLVRLFETNTSYFGQAVILAKPVKVKMTQKTQSLQTDKFIWIRFNNKKM